SPTVSELGAPWAAEYLRRLFLPEGAPADGRRLYLRRGSPRRAILNERDVLDLLDSRGFGALEMGGRSGAEQAALFAGAEAIVSTHGAALANLVFARPGTVAVELMGVNTATTIFAGVAWRRGLRYEMVMGTEPALPKRWWQWQVDAATSVDVRG